MALEFIQGIDSDGNTGLFPQSEVTDAVLDSDFGANQILKADTASTPVGLTVGTQTLVGRAAGSIAALAVADNEFVGRGGTNLGGIAVADNEIVARGGTDLGGIPLAVQEVLLRGSGDLGPVTIGDSEFVGRPAGGDLGAMTAAEARIVLNVEDGADVTDATNVAAAGAVMDTDLVYATVNIPNTQTSHNAASPAGFVNDKPVFASIRTSTTNPVGIARAICTGGNLTIALGGLNGGASGDPGASGADIEVWQDKR